MYTEYNDFEWDSEKARRNILKHGVRFEHAILAFYDPDAQTVEDLAHSAHEPRTWLIGDPGSGVLVVVYTVRSELGRVRVIRARHATDNERLRYEEAKGI